MGARVPGTEHGGREDERRRILVINSTDHLSHELRQYSVHLADRTDCDLLLLSVTAPGSKTDFLQRSERDVRDLQRKAALVGVHCEHIVKHGDLGLAIHQVRNQAKRMAFVVADKDVAGRDELGELTIPVFTVASKTRQTKGDRIMSAKSLSSMSLTARTIACGMLSAGLYTLVFRNADTVMSTFARGGIYAALPIATVFVFSFAHGAFASNLWSLLGIDARKDAPRQTEKKVTQPKKRAQKRPRAYAYVNPFHRM